MRPRAACVTEGHKSPISLPPPRPRTVWRKRIQSSQSSSLSNLQSAAEQETNSHLNLKISSVHTHFVNFFLVSHLFQNTLHLAIVPITQSKSCLVPKSQSVPQETAQVYPSAPSPALAKQSLAAHPLAKGLYKSSDG